MNLTSDSLVPGRTAEARILLKASRDEYVEKEALNSQYALRSRVRWARFLADHSKVGDPDLDTATVELRAVLVNAGDHPWIETAQAHEVLARLAMARSDRQSAIQESRLALTGIERVRGIYDVRIQPEVWLVYSEALLKAGDASSARQWANRALQAVRTYDAPSAAAIQRASAVVLAAS